MNHQALMAVLSGCDRRPAAAALRLALSLAVPCYAAAVAVRNHAYQRRWLPIHRLPRAVISIGNLTTGGTGKTPAVIALTRMLADMGRHPAVLLRGYRAGAAGSDEALEMAAALGPSIPVAAHPDRVQAAAAAVTLTPEVDVFLLDDGFQHRRVHRDLDLVLLDATRPFGFDRLLPRGLLREPPRSLARAHGVILTRADQVGAEVVAALARQVESLTGRPPLAHAVHAWTRLRRHDGGSESESPLEVLSSTPVLAVVAIGNPEAFAAMLRHHAGKAMRGIEVLPDHAAYDRPGLDALAARARQRGATALITTEKDWVKWQPLLAIRPLGMPVLRPVLEMRFPHGRDALMAALRTLG